MAEALSLAEEIQDPTAEHDFHGAAANDAQVLDRLCALREDDRAGVVKFRLGRGGYAIELGRVERVKGRMVVQEPGYLGRGTGAHRLLYLGRRTGAR